MIPCVSIISSHARLASHTSLRLDGEGEGDFNVSMFSKCFLLVVKWGAEPQQEGCYVVNESFFVSCFFIIARNSCVCCLQLPECIMTENSSIIGDVKAKEVSLTSPAVSGTTRQQLSSVSPRWRPDPSPQTYLHSVHTHHSFILLDQHIRGQPQSTSVDCI